MGVRAGARERGKDQAMEAISGRGERGYNDSQIPNQDTVVSACGLVSGAEEVQAPPSSAWLQVLAGSGHCCLANQETSCL